jgi:thiosulfate dehydrogenase [quinone] large subunit
MTGLGITTAHRALTVSALAGIARVALGVLWLKEGLLKYHAHFGAPDIGLVVSSAASNTRVSPEFRWFTTHILGSSPSLFGAVVPLLETCLGIALIIGVVPRLAAFGSALQLCFYWSADQLVAQYPLMAGLSATVLVLGAVAHPLSFVSLTRAVRRHVPSHAGTFES